MEIKQFIGKKIHDYIDINLEFNRELSILVGSNGAGKTSSLILLQALLSPNFNDLINIPFEEIEVLIEEKNKEYSIIARKAKRELTLSSSNCSEPLIIDSKYYDEIDYINLKHSEHSEKSETNEIIFNRFKSTPVLEFILSLSSPLFLNLERRDRKGSSIDINLYRNKYYRSIVGESQKISKYKRQFQGSLGASLLETRVMVQENYRRLRTFEDSFMTRLKDEILFSSFEYIPFDPDSFSDINEKKKLLSKKGEIEKALKRIGYSDNQKFYKKFNDFFEKVEGLLTQVNPDNEGLNIELLTNQYQLEKLFKIAEIIDEFNQKVNERFKVFNLFIHTVNSFFVDTKKEIDVDKVGRLYVKRPNGDKVPIDALSSGERQILIMFANVLFNKKSNGSILIIDEPELSLHIRWQEKFVKSLVSLETKTQFILATHSPDIVSEYKQNCITL